MKLAISNIAWDRDNEAAVFDLLAQYKFEGLEVAPSKIWDDPTHVDARAIQDYTNHVAACQLQVVGIQSALYGHPEMLLFDSEQSRQNMLHHLAEMIRICSALGGKVLVFGNPKNRRIGDVDYQVADQIAVEFFRALGEIAGQHGVVIGLEPNAAEYGTDFMNNTVETLTMVGLVDHPSIQFHLDLGVIQMNHEDIRHCVKIASDQLCHVHISEPFLGQTTASDAHTILAESLRQHHYAGWTSIEMIAAKENQVESVRQSLELVASIYGQ